MIFQFPPWGAAFILGAAVTVVLAVRAWPRRRSSGGWAFFLLMVSLSWWLATAALEAFFVSVPQKVFCSQLEYLAVASVGLLFFFFSLDYSESAGRISPAIRNVLWIVPAGVVVLAFTNASHGLIWSSLAPASQGSFSIVIYGYGPALWFFTGYSYLLLLGSTLILFNLAARTRGLVKSQAAWIIAGALAPWAGNAIYMLKLGPRGVELTPLGFILSGIAFSHSLVRFRLLHTTPVAYSSVFDFMTDAVIAFDMDRKIIEANPAAGILFSVSKEQYGLPLDDVLKPWPEYRDRVSAVIPLSGTRSMQSRRGDDWLETRLFNIYNRAGEVKGGYLLARDITESKRAEEERTAAQERIQLQRNVLLQFSMSSASAEGDFPAAMREITEAAARTLGVERVGIWLGSAEIGNIRCPEIYELSKDLHSPGPVLEAARYPRYFEALHRDRIVDAVDVFADPRTREFSEDYFRPLGIGSLLDSAVRVSGMVVGLVSCEHVGPPRRWLPDEIRFAAEVADAAAHAYANWERRKIEDARRESEERFRMLVEGAPDGIFVEALGNFAYVNEAAVLLFGAKSADELLGRPVLDRIHPDSREQARERMGLTNEARTNIPRMEEIILRLDGTTVPTETAAVAVRHRGLDGILVFVHDITRRKTAADALQASLEEKVVLIREIQNRVRNNMQLVSSLLNHQAGAFSDPALRSAFQSSRDRIKAITLVHERLYRSGDLARIDFGEYLQNLVIHLFQVYQIDPGRIRYEFKLDPSRFDVNVAIPLGLIANELVLNSLQHAFPNQLRGRIFIRLSRNGERFHTLEIADDGVGIPGDFSLAEAGTLGFQLTAMLVEQIEGVVKVETKPGTSFTITFPDKPADCEID
ncbi:MAG: PAS domain S-box protein [Candidatus Aminicenantes bacterium]|nr:PAS domain S-box protein [Candidatus Aminicenantes bacterium]